MNLNGVGQRRVVQTKTTSAVAARGHSHGGNGENTNQKQFQLCRSNLQTLIFQVFKDHEFQSDRHQMRGILDDRFKFNVDPHRDSPTSENITTPHRRCRERHEKGASAAAAAVFERTVDLGRCQYMICQQMAMYQYINYIYIYYNMSMQICRYISQYNMTCQYMSINLYVTFNYGSLVGHC